MFIDRIKFFFSKVDNSTILLIKDSKVVLISSKEIKGL